MENRLGIRDPGKLLEAEERLSKQKALTVLAHKPVASEGSFERLKQIHEHLFAEIYPFAGRLRTVDLSKGTFRFASVRFLNASLHQVEVMPQNTFEEIIEKYVEMNVVHPFREGNGRSLRLWLDGILRKELGQVIDWRRVEKAAYLKAMEASPVRDAEIKALLKKALTDRTDDRALYLDGLDASWAYEGQTCCQARDLEDDQ